MGAYSDFDIVNKGTGISEDPLSAYVNIGGQEPIPGPEAVERPAPVQVADTADGGETVKEDAATEDTGTAVADDEAARKAHEENEARRKAEWDARQAEKKAAVQAQLDQIAAMNDGDLMAASMRRVSDDTEKLTRRNMKDCVSEYIQTRCLEDSTFARMVMHPEKSMIRCFQYINRRAKEYIEQEMKDNDIAPQGIYGSDVPDDLCYQWGEEYFRDPDAKEDHRDDEKFVPRPYMGGRSSSKSKSGTKEKKKTAEKKARKPKETPAPAETSGQISLMEMAS